VLLKLLVEGSQIQTYDFVKIPLKEFYKSFDTFCFNAERSLLHKVLGVCWKTAVRAAKRVLGSSMRAPL